MAPEGAPAPPAEEQLKEGVVEETPSTGTETADEGPGEAGSEGEASEGTEDEVCA